MPQTAE